MIFERISSVLERKATDVSALTWSELFPQSNAKSGVSVNVDSALRQTTVFACSRVLAEGIAQLPKALYDIDPVKSTKIKNVRHPAYKILACEPNEWMTSFEFYETMMFHAVLTGNAYAYIGWAGKKIVEIIPLIPNQVQVVRAADWTLTYNVSDLEGRITTLTSANVLHLRGPSWNAYSGLDAIQLAREAIGLSIATEETHASLHANGAQPGGVLSVKGKLDQPARERLKAAWQAFQGGVANRFKTAVLDVEADWKPLSMTGVDSQHLETRRFQIEEICRAMRVYPQMVMHTIGTTTFASAEQFFLAHVKDSLMPWIVRWEQAINRTILGDDDNLICKFNVNSILRGDSAAQATYFQAALGGARPESAWMTKNEVREALDLNPIEGGDEMPKPPPPPEPGGGFGGKNPPDEELAKALALVLKAFDPSQPRDGDGKWSNAGGAGVQGVGEGATRVKRDWIAQSPLKTIDDVYKGVPENKSALDRAGDLVARESGAKYIPGPVKNVDRVLQKVANGKPVNGVNDIVRSTFYASSAKQADSIVAALAKVFPVADEGYKVTPAGYFDRSMNVRFPNGQLGEVLIMPPEMAKAKKEGGHKLYNGIRNLPQGHPMQKVLLETSRQLYKRVYDALPPDWKAAVGNGGS